MAAAVGLLYHPDNTYAGMKETILNGKKVVIYDSIDTLPVVRFHHYNRYLIVDSGIGSDMTDFDAHIEKVVRYIRKGDNENAAKEMENMRQNVYMILEGQNVRHLSFACLVKSIDGVEQDDLSPEGLTRVLEQLGGAPLKDVTASAEEVKKKIDQELTLFFPALFDDVRTREYYDVLKRLTVTQLEQIADGDSDERKRRAEELRERLILYVKPKVFTGHDGVEVKHDKDFETMCLVITKETGRDAKRMTVLEYYNAYEYIKNQQKRQNKAR